MQGNNDIVHWLLKGLYIVRMACFPLWINMCVFAFSTRTKVRVNRRHAYALPSPEADDSKRLCFSPHVHVRFRGRHQR
jgi:hypothetical protein